MKSCDSPHTIGFPSRLARWSAALSAAGFLSGLGFVPGWHRLMGFSGFFGFIGVAFIIEGIHCHRAAKAIVRSSTTRQEDGDRQ